MNVPASARTVAALVASLVLTLLVAAPVLGHAELESSDPADKAVLDTPPTTITLTFSAGLHAAKSSFRVMGADGEAGTGKASKNGATVMTAEGLALAAGSYTIAWTSVAEDGDIERGQITFVVNAEAPSPSAAASAQPSTAATATATAVPSSSGAAGTPAEAASGGDVLIPIVAALVLVAVTGAFVLRRSRSA